MDEEMMTIDEVWEYLNVEEANTKELRKEFIYKFAAWAVSFQPTDTLKTMWEAFLESDRG